MTLPESRVDVAIVGGGIAGLALAYRMRVSAPDLTVVLLEASNRLGGKVLTERIAHDDGVFIIEGGPDSFLATKPWAKALAIELGLENRLVPVNTVPRSVGILKQGRWVDLPEGVALLAPTKIRPIVETSLLSWRGKLRAAGDLVVPRRRDESDESLGSFVRRRFGPELLEWIAEPLAAGIYNADPDDLSMAATFPNLAAIERTHGSLIRGLRAMAPPAGTQRSPAFVSFRAGVQELIDALAMQIGDRAVVGSKVTSVAPAAQGGYHIDVSENRVVDAAQIVLALPAAAAARLLESVAPESTAVLRTLRAVSAGTLTIAVRDRDIERPLPGYGLVIPHAERQPFNAITIASRKFPERAPEGWAVIRLFFGGHRTPETFDRSDDQIIATGLATLRQLVGLSGAPAFCRIHRWPHGSPQYAVGHLERVAEITDGLPPNIHLLGSPFLGVGIPDIVRSANDLAVTLINSAKQGVVHVA